MVEYEEKNIILIGPSGTGKSTFINTLFLKSTNVDITKINEVLIPNKFFQKTIKKYENVRIEENPKDPSVSQTMYPYFYDINLEEKQTKVAYKFNILDTPGFCDTKGDIIYDEYYLREILKEIENGHDKYKRKIHAIVVVLHAGDVVRLDVAKKYVYTRIRNVIPNEYIPNIILLLTHTENPPDMDALKYFFNGMIPEDHIFNYDNKIFREDISKLQSKKLEKLQESYEDNIEIFDNIISTIVTLPAVSSEYFITTKKIEII